MKELNLGIKIVHRCFTQRGNSTLSVFCCELLQVKVENKYRVFWLAYRISHVIDREILATYILLSLK